MLTKTDLIEKMRDAGVCEVFFTKSDGEDREMYCTLSPPRFEGASENYHQVIKQTDNPDIISVWDLEVGDCRSFRIDSIYEMWIDGDLIIPEPVVLTPEQAVEQGLSF